jgi:uncharacterized membrane-anchored protein
MSTFFRHQLALIALLMVSVWSGAQEQPAPAQPQPPKINWQDGPVTGKLGDIAEIRIPEGYSFTDKHGTETLLEMTQNIPSGRELGALIPNVAKPKWFMTFEFTETGYVKDEEKDKLDAAALLKTLQEGTEEANEERKKRGWEAFHVTGWEKAPFYDPQTHNLTWAIRGKGDDPRGGLTINHSIRLLGRKGTVNVELVASPEMYAQSVAEFNDLIAGFAYNQGSRYADFIPGDKVAEYGLGALIVGGAGAVALKTGLFSKFLILLAKLWKVIIVALAAGAAAIKKFFKAIFGNEDKIEDPSQQPENQ